MGGNHDLSQPPSNFIVKTGCRERDRRSRRHQHVESRRTHDTVGQQSTMASQNAVSTMQEREQPILENAAFMRAVNALAHHPETFANTVDPGHSTTEELEAATQIRPTLPRQEERHHTSRMGQEDAPHVPSQGETQSHNILPPTSVTLGCGINDIADALFHPKTTSENDQESYESDPESLPCDSDLLEQTESFERTPEENLPGIISDTLKEEYFALLLHSFNVTQQPAPTDVASSQDRPQGSSSASKGKHRAASPHTTDSSQHWSSKRIRRRSPDKGDQDDQEGEGNRGNAPGGPPPSRDDNGRAKDLLFACPFVKRYPHRYLKCFSHSLKDIPRVKQHLFRDKTHCLPIYCPNCSHTFEREDIRDEHIRDAQCVKRPLVKWEGITESQRRQLSKRSSSTRSPEENWYGVFKILFPGDPLPSNPYIDTGLSGELRAFREHLLVEGPRIWNDLLTSQLPEHLRPYLEELQSLHDSFYAESIVRLCEGWYLQCLPSSSIDARRTREYETIPDAVPAPVAVPYLRNGSRIRVTDARSGYHPTDAAHGDHSVVVPSSSILQLNHLLLDDQSMLSVQPTLDVPTVTDPLRRLEASPYPGDIANSTGQSHIGAPRLQLRALGRVSKDICVDSSRFGDTSDGLDATFQSAYPSQGEPPSFSSPLAQSQSNSQDIFELLNIDGF